MNEIYKIYFIIIVILICFYKDIISDKCFTNSNINTNKKRHIFFNLLIHHIITIYAACAFIFNNKILLYIHIFLILLIYVQQFIIYIASKYIYNIDSVYCILTLIKNKLCNEKLTTHFKSLIHNLDIIEYRYIISTLVLLISILKIYLL
jgi:hypothetical protein